MAFRIQGCQGFSQEHQPATLGVNWPVRFCKITNLLEQAGIGAEFSRIQLGISAAEVQSMQVLRQDGIFVRTELRDFCAIVVEEVEIALVIKRERPIAGDTDADAFVLGFSATYGCGLRPSVVDRRI